jgi:U1 small nuclear ribonucleoprotein
MKGTPMQSNSSANFHLVAYKEADGKKIDGRRVVVDYERGRTSKQWRPRRLGGGRGFSRAGGEDLNAKFGGAPSKR